MQSSSGFSGVQALVNVMKALRDPDTGCPWDLKQTMESLIPYTIEEAYEVADAISNGNQSEIKAELGDLLFQVVFYARLAEEQGHYDFDAVAQTMAEKLIHRHPHVFGDERANDADEVKSRWEEIKRTERELKDRKASVFADVPGNLPALLHAGKIQKRAASVGFDWNEAQQVIEKIKEETEEVTAEITASEPDKDRIEDEIGDLLFAVVNLARHTKTNPESALRRANRKFMSRFESVESKVAAEEKVLHEMTLEELEERWQCAKQQTKF